MLLLGIDIGTSSIKVSVIDSETQETVASAQYPDTESEIIALQPGWAEQDPEMWWNHVRLAILRLNSKRKFNRTDIGTIGIGYQMHGLVVVDKEQKVLRNSIIWCDSRAVEIGDEAFRKIGPEKCLFRLLNSPGNFTASKLAWVKQNEPEIYQRIDKIMLPGDFIAMKLSGEITCSNSSLSEGVFWDFQSDSISEDVVNYFGFSTSLFPPIKPVFSEHGLLKETVAGELSLKPGIPISYKAGDQPNNALSLNVLRPGEVAANAGTSGVIYGVTDKPFADKQSRVNSFAHVNHTAEKPRLGVLLCVNGCGIMNRWVRDLSPGTTYKELNLKASKIASDGLFVIPFGNGAERILNNRVVGSHVHNLDLNHHSHVHMYRATQEGIAFALRYGLDIMRENGMDPTVIRAGRANMFLSDVFTKAFVDVTNIPVEFYESDGSKGAAIGAGIGAKIYSNADEAFTKAKRISIVQPEDHAFYEEKYQQWRALLLGDIRH
jgi:xylulokinase